jgi:hypothetical protein
MHNHTRLYDVHGENIKMKHTANNLGITTLDADADTEYLVMLHVFHSEFCN